MLKALAVMRGLFYLYLGMPRKSDIEKMQKDCRKRYGIPEPDLMLTADEAAAKRKEAYIGYLAERINKKLFFIDAQEGERKKKPKAVIKKIIEIGKTMQAKKREDRDDTPLRVLNRRTDHSDRSEEFFTRPPAVYSNTTPFGIAQEMLNEQLKEENSFKFAKKRRF